MNCLTCMNGNLLTSMFKIPPPTIDQYLPLDEELELAPLVVFHPEGAEGANDDEDDNSSNEDEDEDNEDNDDMNLW